MAFIFTVENQEGVVLNRYYAEDTPENIDRILYLNDAGSINLQDLEKFVTGKTNHTFLNENEYGSYESYEPCFLTRQTEQELKEQLRQDYEKQLALIDSMIADGPEF